MTRARDAQMDLVDALLSRLAPLPATPETPLSASRCYWEYIQRRYEQSRAAALSRARREAARRSGYAPG